MKKYAVLWMLSLVLLSCGAGCSEDEDTVCGYIPPRPPSIDFPDTQYQVLANFQTIMEECHFDWYRDLLHADFRLVLQEATRNAFPDLGPTMDLDEDLRSAERMFSGDDMVDPDGKFVPGVIDISFGIFEAEEAWRPVPSDSDIPGDSWVPMKIELLFNRGQGQAQISCKGVLEFFVTGTDSLHGGEVRKYYQISGIRDLTTVDKPLESAAYGTVRALYR